MVSRRLWAVVALVAADAQVTSDGRLLGASSGATSGTRFVASRVAAYDGPRHNWTSAGVKALPRPWSACERCGVVTTINAPTEAIFRVGNASGWCLVVVGDKKTDAAPYEALAAARPETVAYLGVAAQQALPYGTAAATPWNHFARKNLGYLYAMHAGAKTIFDFDDDNELVAPLPASAGAGVRALRPRVAKPLGKSGGGSAFVNAYAAGFGGDGIWPRGLPLPAINADAEFRVVDGAAHAEDLDGAVGAAQGLADHDPDVDAIYRLGPRAALPLPFAFPKDETAARSLVLDDFAVCPFNAQATLFDRHAFFALLLPHTVHGRVADIWRGYVAQRLFRLAGLKLAFLPPLVRQMRNDHDLQGDYMSERPLYETAEALVRLLDDAQVRRNGAGAVARAFEDVYVALYEFGFLQLDDVRYLQLWIADLAKVGVAFPDARARSVGRPGRPKARRPARGWTPPQEHGY